MVGLGAIHVFDILEGEDARDKRGHDKPWIQGP
jgi:hypothetical protein